MRGGLSCRVNQKVSKTAHIKELNQEMDRLKAELLCTREKNGSVHAGRALPAARAGSLLLSTVLSALQDVNQPEVREYRTEAQHQSRHSVCWARHTGQPASHHAAKGPRDMH